MTLAWSDEESGVQEVRALALAGRLVADYDTAGAERRRRLRRGVHAIVWPVVFERFTRRFEAQRGHVRCARDFRLLAPECLDRFHEAVDTVVDDVLRKATVPVRQLEAWVAARVMTVTVNGHRVRRGQRGALQRPAVPQWLRRALGEDAWLVQLALLILTWVGIPTTAGTGVWPVDAWADQRAAATGDPAGSDTGAVLRDVDRVLAAMRGRPAWYDRYVERPLGHKPVPLAPMFRDAGGRLVEPPPLALVQPHERHDAALLDLAAAALVALDARLAAGVEPARAVAEVVDALVRVDPVLPTEVPHAGAGPDVDHLLADDPAARDRLVAALLDIVADRDGHDVRDRWRPAHATTA